MAAMNLTAYTAPRYLAPAQGRGMETVAKNIKLKAPPPVFEDNEEVVVR